MSLINKKPVPFTALRSRAVASFSAMKATEKVVTKKRKDQGFLKEQKG